MTGRDFYSVEFFPQTRPLVSTLSQSLNFYGRKKVMARIFYLSCFFKRDFPDIHSTLSGIIITLDSQP